MKKIVFAMIEAGGGHKAPARAVMEALEDSRPGRYELRMMDFIKDIGSVKVDASHKKSWKTMLEYPTITHILYQLENSFAPASRALMYRTMVAPAIPDAIRFVRTYRPDVVFSTHFFATVALTEAKRRTGATFPIITYQTEMFTFHAPWKVVDTDWYITASERAAESAARHGIAREKLKTFPYPIRPGFLETRRDQAVVAKELGLEEGRKTFLFSFGNQGAGMILQYLIALDLQGERLNVIVVAGLNKSLRARLEASAGLLTHLNIIPLGFAENMNELIEAADVCFIKPGPATMMECMHSRKPIIFGVAATPCEQEHANYATFRGVARCTEGNAMLFGRAARHFLKDEVRAEVARRYEILNLRNGSADIAAFVDEVAQGKIKNEKASHRGDAEDAEKK
jgi:UDP-N-acetylglucosamine:LPS N-acetylglucosamine transferase